MITVLIILIFSGVIVKLLINTHRSQLRHKPTVFGYLFAYHTFFFIAYYLYALSTTSDSFEYYSKTLNHFRGANWFDYYGNGTVFVEFIAYPFIHGFGLSYEAIMLLFSLFGYIGFFYFYLFLTESTQYRHKLWGIDFLLLLLFLPNMHFWTVSFGKGSIMFMGLGLFFYGLKKVSKRWLILFLGALILYHVRAHVFLIAMLAISIAVFTTSKGLSFPQKVFLLIIAIATISPALSTFLEYAKLDDLSGDSTSAFLEHRGSDLSKATSGVNINNYNQVQKIFAFLFRPLFFDAPGALGIFVSFENLFYLLIAFKVISFSFLKFIWQTHWLTKVAFLFFIGASVALAQISGNLGLAIRQKSQVMYLFFFVLLAYADYVYRTKGKVIIGE